MKKTYIIIGILVAVVAVLFMFKGSITGNVAANLEPIEEGNLIKIPLSQVSENAQWLNYNNAKYFVVKAKDGSIKTAFDACDICYNSKKGYRQEGNDVICNNCGNHYPISALGSENVGGGCWPGYLANRVEGDYLVINKADLDAGEQRYFK